MIYIFGHQNTNIYWYKNQISAIITNKEMIHYDKYN